MNRSERVAPRPLVERIGILQGRLVSSATGELQCSPGSRWREEFSIASELGLSHIELLAEGTLEPSNPIWSADGRRELVAVAGAAGVGLTSLSINEPLQTSFDDMEGALDLAARLAPVVADLEAQILVLPLLEASDLNVLGWSRVAQCVRLLGDHIHRGGARLALEVAVSAADSLRFLGTVNSQRVGLCYDLGNATALGFDTAAELRMLGPHVWHVHAKDKDARQQNVRFGTGEVQFAPALAALALHGFDGVITMEATRGEDPAITAAEHRAFLVSMERLGMRAQYNHER